MLSSPYVLRPVGWFGFFFVSEMLKDDNSLRNAGFEYYPSLR